MQNKKYGTAWAEGQREDYLRRVVALRTEEIDQNRAVEFATVHKVPQSILAELMEGITIILRCYWHEVSWQEQDFAQRRRQLTETKRAAQVLATSIAGMDSETWDILEQAGMAYALANKDEPFFARTGQRPKGELPFTFVGRNEREFDLTQFLEMLSNMQGAMTAAERTARKGKKGRPSDDAAINLMMIAYQFWAELLQRPFKLDWTSENEPITDAARWCTDLARMIDPNIAMARVVTASRNAAKNWSEAKSLQK